MRKFLVPIMATALVVLMSSSAQAATRDITDPSGDVVTATTDPTGDHLERLSRAEGDIVFTRIQHTATAVVVYMRFRQLTVPKQYATFEFSIHGNNGIFVDAAINTRHRHPQGNSYALLRRQGEHLCAHSNKINYAGDSAWMRIARACLKNPKYIRVEEAKAYESRVSPAGDWTNSFDIPTRDGFDNWNQLSDSRTPWVVTD